MKVVIEAVKSDEGCEACSFYAGEGWCAFHLYDIDVDVMMAELLELPDCHDGYIYRATKEWNIEDVKDLGDIEIKDGLDD